MEIDSETFLVEEAKVTCLQRHSKVKAQEQIASWMRDIGSPEDVED